MVPEEEDDVGNAGLNQENAIFHKHTPTLCSRIIIFTHSPALFFSKRTTIATNPIFFLFTFCRNRFRYDMSGFTAMVVICMFVVLMEAAARDEPKFETNEPGEMKLQHRSLPWKVSSPRGPELVSRTCSCDTTAPFSRCTCAVYCPFGKNATVGGCSCATPTTSKTGEFCAIGVSSLVPERDGWLCICPCYPKVPAEGFNVVAHAACQ